VTTKNVRSFRLVLLVTAFLSLAPAASAEATIDWVTVSDPGNACDTQPQGCFGSVAMEYRISKFEITNAQYAEFLNAVAETDTNGLHSASMGSGFGGITQSGSTGSFTYSAIGGRQDMPVNYVSFWDAARFANWLYNGQPMGAQDNTTTEDGAYTLTPSGITNNTVTRNVGATVFVSSEDEWYKAAYYDPGTMIYFDFPAGSVTQTTCAVPGVTANTANCDNVVSDLTDVGSYTGAASPGSTFDQGGNVWEWSDTIISGTDRGLRGGGFDSSPLDVAAPLPSTGPPAGELNSVGFRVASLVPAPPTVPSLSPLGIALVGSLLGLAGLRRLRS
jgi:formylglycine-generating enzyme required for sulfatase activity